MRHNRKRGFLTEVRQARDTLGTNLSALWQLKGLRTKNGNLPDYREIFSSIGIGRGLLQKP